MFDRIHVSMSVQIHLHATYTITHACTHLSRYKSADGIDNNNYGLDIDDGGDNDEDNDQ